MTKMQRDSRPVFLNLFKIRFPITAILSIMHRVMGVALVALLPFLIYLLDLSLSSEAGFQNAATLVHNNWIRLLSVGFVWALTHHLFAGIRFLLLDLEIGIEKHQARASAYAVNVAAILVTLICWVILL